ncbi:hypothetical protein HMPREF2617_04945 [Corynebacterium sp. HMSC070H05]|uniref:glycosyltransferase n=1 Tax=Corynebacterium sp. HMSC070H05 TaxID=1715096 RepID=UPI0008A83AF5|nr:glycosyltransferase [Corynebacterium sp. HMSC070H05]OHQ56291.1 hypothetical protein HMPREF2617_04945 [Corynebacterium sp. HMSC070H05]
MPLLSVIIPTYNVASKISKCLASLDVLKTVIGDLEVILVDDHSVDDTYAVVCEYASSRDWVVPIRLDANNGTPSIPRNMGLERATGEFVFHLDPDDEILPAGVAKEIEIARQWGADVVRAPLVRDNGKTRTVMNRLNDWSDDLSRSERIEMVVKNHSTTVCGVYRRQFLIDNQIWWPSELRLAEDAIFLYKSLSLGKFAYSDEPDFVYHVAVESGSASSTQQYQDRELSNHLTAWSWSSELLGSVGVDYFALRGQVALSSAIQNMIRFNRGGLSRGKFDELRLFLQTHRNAVDAFNYGPRFSEICNFILEGRYSEFLESIKLRLLIAGYDLRFILPAIPELSKFYQVRVDEWSGHDSHDEEVSRRLLNWADAIHCEWMLGNAVWYSQNKGARQSLQVRLHRFETSKEYGHMLNREAVDKVITIAPGMFEETQRVFDFDRSKVAYVPNYIKTESYIRSDDPNKVFNLVMVGSVPIRKGYKRALVLLKSLREIDPRYNLTVFGKKAEELGWVYNDAEERRYFRNCERYIRQNGLESAVRFEGWVDTSEALADKGFILSLSDAEGSHVAAAEGFAAGNITLLRPWEGAEYMYPKKYIFDRLVDMRDFVLSCRDFETFKAEAEEGIEYVETRYPMSRFLELYSKNLPVPYSVP